MRVIPKLSQYLQGICDAVNRSDLTDAFESARDLLLETQSKIRTVYVGGNGGSAAIANHLCCDFMKGSGIKTVSLSSNVPLITAIGNDYGYQQVLAKQLGYLGCSGDVVILISSSGQSANIKQAVIEAKSKGIKIIGLSGFDGGYLADNSDISLHVNYDNYGIVEDVHQMLMHSLAQSVVAANETSGSTISGR